MGLRGSREGNSGEVLENGGAGGSVRTSPCWGKGEIPVDKMLLPHPASLVSPESGTPSPLSGSHAGWSCPSRGRMSPEHLKRGS